MGKKGTLNADFCWNYMKHYLDLTNWKQPEGGEEWKIDLKVSFRVRGHSS